MILADDVDNKNSYFPYKLRPDQKYYIWYADFDRSGENVYFETDSLNNIVQITEELYYKNSSVSDWVL